VLIKLGFYLWYILTRYACSSNWCILCFENAVWLLSLIYLRCTVYKFNTSVALAY